MQQINTTLDLPVPHSMWLAAQHKEVDDIFANMGKRIPAPSWIDDSAAEWAAALPIALIKQTRKKHHGRSDKKLTDAYAQLTDLGFSEIDIELARLNDEGLLMLSSAQTHSARAADGYSSYEPAGRPEHDRRFNMKRLRARRAEVIANLEIALKLIGKDHGQAQYCGDESKRLRDEANKRTAKYLANAKVVIPVRGENGAITGEKMIPLEECGNTRYKSLSAFIGFTNTLSVLAQDADRKAVMVSGTVPPHMHPSSPKYDGKTTPRQANKWLSKKNKASRDLLRKWRINEAGVGTKEPHASGVLHSHLLMFHDAHKIAELHYINAIEVMRMQFEIRDGEVVESDEKMSVEDAEAFLLSEFLLGKINLTDPDEFSPAMTREEFIDGMAKDLIERAFEHQFLDLERDDDTGRLVHGVGVNFKYDTEKSSKGASLVSYVLTYVLKSFFISIDNLPKRSDFASDEEHRLANSEAIKQQVESGGDLAIRACTAAHGVRTREMWGMPSRSPFNAIGKQHNKIDDAGMEDMRQKILNNQHYDYVVSQGGLNSPRNMAKFKMKSVKMESSYALRPELTRRRVLGVVRCKPVLMSVKKKNKDIDMIVMIPEFQHNTRIEGCYIVSGHSTTKSTALRGDSVGALVPNYPRAATIAAKIGTSPPSKIPITLH